MSKVERPQDNPSQSWQKVDARILGQILAAQNVVFTLPDTIRIAEFYAQILISIPGITACRVCLGGRSVQVGEMASGVCAECETLCHSAWENGTLIPTDSGFKCGLADLPGMQAIAIDSYQHHFGFFVFPFDKAALSELYQPFICNLSNYVALILENRLQKDLLQKANDELERKVAERTHELTAANEALAASRLAALDMMKEAIEARQYAEQATTNLQHEITEHKRDEEKLKVSEARLRLTLEFAQIGVWDWDVANDRYFASPIYYTMLGYDPKQDSADRGEWGQWLHPDDQKTVLEQVNNVLSRTCNEYAYEARFRHADGSYRWLWAIGYGAKYDSYGKAIRMLELRMDIDKRKRMEDELSAYRGHLEELVRERTSELEEARNKARQYLDIAGVILVAIDARRRVTLINQKGCEVLQSISGEIIGKDWFETFIPENVRQDALQGFRQLMAGELEPMEYFENPVMTPGGRERLVAWHNVLLRDGDGNITGTLSSGEDITARRLAEKQIIKLNQDLQKRATALEAANKELDAFAYSVSHDLRAPLRHIDGFLKLLQKKAGTALDEPSRHYMDTISSAAQKMGVMIDDLLTFSRMGRQALSFQPVALGPLVRDVIGEFEPDAAGRHIDWRIGELPAVSGDAAMLRLVLSNLLSNAIKYTRPRQQAEIEIGSLPGQASETVIFVRDNGVGFDMTYVDKLFGVFQRLHRADEFEGTGIGLANVRRIIARHGGRTWAEGKPDQGAVFYFALPQA